MEKLFPSDLFLYKEKHSPVYRDIDIIMHSRDILFGKYSTKFSCTNPLISGYNQKKFLSLDLEKLAIEIANFYAFSGIKECNLVSSIDYFHDWVDKRQKEKDSYQNVIWQNFEMGVDEQLMKKFSKKLKEYGLNIKEIKLIEFQKQGFESNERKSHKSAYDYFFKH